MNHKVLIILLMVPLCTGCATDPAAEQRQATRTMEYKMQVYGPACEKLGYEKETDAWRECIQREYAQTLIRQQPLWNAPGWNPYLYPPYYYRPCVPTRKGWYCQ